MKYHFIPENFNLDKQIQEYPVTNFKKFNPDHLYYIFDKLFKIPVFNKNVNISNGFIPLSSTALQDKIPNYSQYIKYLIDSKVIVSDNRYIPEEKCIGYKFTNDYNTKVAKVGSRMKSNINNAEQKMAQLKVHKDYKHLIKWFNEDLSIDYKLAKDFIEVDLQRKINDPALQNYTMTRWGVKDYKDPYTQYNCSLIGIDYLKNKNFFYNVDKKGRRLHTNLTNIKSNLRNCLSYQGEILISIDIKNSQPYLCILLLQPSFWEEDSQELDKITINNYKSLKNKIFKNIKEYKNFIMLLKSPRIQDSPSFQKFIEEVSNGSIYEYMESKLKERNLHRHINSRKDLKQMMFLVLFTNNRFRKRHSALPKELFIKIFPEVYEILKQIKKHGNELLPILLQNIESTLIIKKATKKIAILNPNAPLYTIHDSIVTTAENQLLAYNILEQTLTKYVGYKPSLSVEVWAKEALEFNDKTSYWDFNAA